MSDDERSLWWRDLSGNGNHPESGFYCEICGRPGVPGLVRICGICYRRRSRKERA